MLVAVLAAGMAVDEANCYCQWYDSNNNVKDKTLKY